VRVAWIAENVRVCGESAVMSGPVAVLDRFLRYRFTAPNIAEIAENKKRTN
jgi:rRNA maturation protein Nop10